MLFKAQFNCFRARSSGGSFNSLQHGNPLQNGGTASFPDDRCPQTFTAIGNAFIH